MKQLKLIESINELEIITCKKGFQNTILQARLHGEIVFVKIYGEKENLSLETSVLRQIEGHTFTKPRLLAHDQDKMLNVLTPVSGRAITKTDCVNGVFDNFIISLRELHHLVLNGAVKAVPALDLASLFEKRILLSEHISVIEKVLVFEVLERIKSILQEQGQCFVHGDLNASNVLYSPECKKVGFIDFERAKIGHPFTDLAKFSWRVLDNEIDLVNKLLTGYLGCGPDRYEQALFNAYQALEYMGAISYFAYEGYRFDYPFKDQAIQQLCQWPLFK